MKVKLIEKEIVDSEEVKELGFDFDKEYEANQVLEDKAVKINMGGVNYTFADYEYQTVNS
jgi:hypothetical protein